MTSFVELTESKPGTPVPMHEDIGKLNSEYKKMVGQGTYRSTTPELRGDWTSVTIEHGLRRRLLHGVHYTETDDTRCIVA